MDDILHELDAVCLCVIPLAGGGLFGHSYDKEFDDFLGTISIVVGIVDDFHLLLENGNNMETQYDKYYE